MLQLHLRDQKFYCLPRCDLYQRFQKPLLLRQCVVDYATNQSCITESYITINLIETCIPSTCHTNFMFSVKEVVIEYSFFGYILARWPVRRHWPHHLITIPGSIDINFDFQIGLGLVSQALLRIISGRTLGSGERKTISHVGLTAVAVGTG